MSDIKNYSQKKIADGLNQARSKHNGEHEHVRVVFAPTRINETNFNQACDIYSRIDPADYDTVVIVEVHEEMLPKKLPMPSNRHFETPLGKVPANDYLRNEFCDEDDDFFIHDEAFNKDMSLFAQLMMLQGVFDDDIEAVSIQIADENHYIIKELAYVLEEVLASRNALLVFCCNLEGERKKEFENIKKMLDDKSHSKLLNYLNSGQSHITGTAAFIAGIIVAHKWGLRLNFINEDTENSLITAYADWQRVLN